MVYNGFVVILNFCAFPEAAIFKGALVLAQITF